MINDFCEYKRTCFLREKYLLLKKFQLTWQKLMHANERCFIVNCIKLEIEIS